MIMAIGGIVLFEFMLPDQGSQYRAGAAGHLTLAQRGAEMAALVNRAVVRPGTRLRRGSRRPGKGEK
jgi:hypothetical protein